MGRAVISVERRKRLNPFPLELGILILLGLGIRFWKIDHGLPYFFYSDEGIFTYQALNMGGQGLNPHYFVHPNLFLYLLLFLDGIFILGGMATGIFGKPGDAWQLFVRDPTVFYVIGRSASAVFGTLTILVVYLIGKRVFNKKVGFLGALFFAVSPLHVQWSQLAYSDVLLTFFIALAFFFAFLAYDQGRHRYFIISGLVSGLSASTKYQGLVTFLWGPLASFLFAIKNETHPIREVFGKRDFLFLIFSVLGFTLGTPFWILDFQRFQDQFLWDWTNLKTFGAGQLGYEGDWNWSYYLMTALPHGIGWPVEICGILGLLLLVSQFKIRNLFFMSFPTVYFFVIGLSRIRVTKYLLPIFPFLCLAAAFFLAMIFSKVSRREARETRLAWFVINLFIVLPSLFSTVYGGYLRILPDSRELAYAWVLQHIPPKSKVLKSYYTFPSGTLTNFLIQPLDNTLMDQRFKNRSSLKLLDQYRKKGVEYLILDEWHMGIATIAAASEPRRWKVVERYKSFSKELEKSVTLLASFSPYRDDPVPFDMENVEIPSRSLWKMKSTGPTVWIYKL